MLDVELALADDVLGVEVEERVELCHHPRQGDVCGARVGVAAADIGVHAGEPALHERVGQQLPLGLLPDGGREGLAVLVEGEGVEGVLDVGGDGRVDERVLQRAFRPEPDVGDA